MTQTLPASELLRFQANGCRMSASPSPFYADLFDALAADAERDPHAAVVRVLDLTPRTVESAAPLRMLGGVHRLVLDGTASDLAPHWGIDAVAAIEPLRALLAAPPRALLDALGRDPQTNEVGRSAGLALGLAVIGARTQLPLRIFEIGSSGGLNLRLDRFAYATASGRSWGPEDSVVRFGPDAYPNDAPFDAAAATIAERRGCDLHPIDATTVDGQHRLVSYVWPDQHARLDRLRAALAIAATLPVAIDTASADDWVDEHLRPQAGAATVLLHSIMWQYLPVAVQQRVSAVMASRGAAATADAPLAWLRLEPAPELVHADVRVRTWPGGDELVLATSGYHGPPVAWTGVS